MVRIGLMASPKSLLDRRELMAGLGAAALLPIWPATARLKGAPRWRCRPRPTSLRFGRRRRRRRSGRSAGPEIRFKRGDTVDVAFANELPQPAGLNWRGIDGAAASNR